MRWLVEITDITDKRFLSDLFARLNTTLFAEEDRIYLTSDDFNSLSSSFKIWTQVNQIRDIVCEISSGLDTGISFNLGTVYEQKEDGSRSGTIFLSVSSAVARAVACDAEFTVTSDISEEDKLRLEEERLERKYQEKLALVTSRVGSALRDERALKVYRFLQQELNPLRMGHIMDLIKADLGGELNNLASKNELSRFSRSINHPEVFGNDSRHITSNEKPPTNPMSLSEAQGFVSRIADLWFKRKCVEDNNVQKP